MDVVQRLSSMIRGLRYQLFYLQVHDYGQERTWEDEEEERFRERRNQEAKKAWDADTEKMIEEMIRGTP